MWHKQQIRAFWKKLYNEQPIMTHNSIQDWIAVKSEPMVVFKEEYNKKFIHDIAIELNLPILVKAYSPFTYKSKTYFHIDDWKPIKAVPKKEYSFTELINKFYCDFEHEQPEDFLFYKLVALASLVTRTNFRIETPRGFGKTFPFKMLSEIGENVKVVSPQSDSSIRMRLNCKLLVLDEISAPTSEQQHLIQQFLLTAGAGDDFYEAPVRGSAQWGTQDSYKIFNLSLIILHNPREYYEAKQQVYFEDAFTPAVLDRFLKLNLKGQLLFTGKSPKDLLINHDEDTSYILDLQKWIATINYYKLNWKRELIASNKIEWIDNLRFEMLSERKIYQITFLLAMLALYSQSHKIFTLYINILNEKLEDNNPNMLTVRKYVQVDPAIEDVQIKTLEGDEIIDDIQ